MSRPRPGELPLARLAEGELMPGAPISTFARRPVLPKRQGAGAATSLRCGAKLTNWLLPAIAALALAGCAAAPQTHLADLGPGAYDPRLGVRASPKLVPDGQPIPKGGGTYLVGRPYVVAGRVYRPSERPYSAIGIASWYGDAFQGRRTANGEVFDKTAIAAAHPTMPLPSYARVTNLVNNRSIIVRVNDRGPYAAGRVIDVSERVADALDFRGRGTARVRVEYIGQASLDGSDDNQLLATLRTDGSPATLDGAPAQGGSLFAQAASPPWPQVASEEPPPQPGITPVAQTEPDSGGRQPAQSAPALAEAFADTPLPPPRPFDLAGGRLVQAALVQALRPSITGPVPLPAARPNSLAAE